MMRSFLCYSVLYSILFFASCSKDSGSNEVQPPVDTAGTTTPVDPVPTVKINDNDNLLMGNPSKATLADDNNYLLTRTSYTLSYNRSRGIPNWVSWHLYSADLGSTSRGDDFEPDPVLPFSWYAVTSDSYSNVGFDRGHNCPSADRTASVDANASTFYMTNIIPQAPKLNQMLWSEFENYTRSLVQSGSEEYVIMGNYGEGGVGNSGAVVTSIDNNNVTVPATIWKIVVVMENGNNDTSRVTTSTRVIAVSLPNNNSIGSNSWKQYRTSVDAIEAATGLDLLSRLPVSVQAAIEAKVDAQ